MSWYWLLPYPQIWLGLCKHSSSLVSMPNFLLQHYTQSVRRSTRHGGLSFSLWAFVSVQWRVEPSLKTSKSCHNLFLYFYSREYHFEKLTILEKTVSDNVALRDIDGRMISPMKIIYLQFLIFRKMFIGGLSWQTTPGTILARYFPLSSAFFHTKTDEFIFLIST